MGEVTPIVVRRLGVKPFREVWELQRELQQALIHGEAEDTLLLCEHTPVITAGTSTKETSLLASSETLAAAGIDYFKIERGGDITYHGPGQVVGYPIVNLNRKRRDVHWYMRSLEEVVIETLGSFGLHAERVKGCTGVWMQDTEKTGQNPARKVASIGVRISRWCTMHGFALNVLDQSAGFRHIHPCGFSDIIVTSMEQEQLTQKPANKTHFNVSDVEAVVIERFCTVFGYTTHR